MSVSYTHLDVYKRQHAFIIALFFGGFQALMPVFGWLAGDQLAVIVSFWACLLYTSRCV